MDMDESANQKFLGLVHALSRNLFNSCRLTNMSFFSNHGMYNCFGPVLDDLVLVKTEIRGTLLCFKCLYVGVPTPKKERRKRNVERAAGPGHELAGIALYPTMSLVSEFPPKNGVTPKLPSEVAQCL